MHGAGAALGNAATVFGAGQPELLAYHPQQRRVWLRLKVSDFAIDVQFCHRCLLVGFMRGLVALKRYPEYYGKSRIQVQTR